MTLDPVLHFSRHVFWMVADVSLSALADSLSWLGARCRDGGMFCARKRGQGDVPHVD